MSGETQKWIPKFHKGQLVAVRDGGRQARVDKISTTGSMTYYLSIGGLWSEYELRKLNARELKTLGRKAAPEETR